MCSSPKSGPLCGHDWMSYFFGCVMCKARVIRQSHSPIGDSRPLAPGTLMSYFSRCVMCNARVNRQWHSPSSESAYAYPIAIAYHPHLIIKFRNRTIFS